MERKDGRGRPGAPTELPSPKEQGSSKTTPEGGKDYSGTISSIRADQDVETFAADLRQNKEQLLSLARKLTAKPADTRLERGANLGVCLT